MLPSAQIQCSREQGRTKTKGLLRVHEEGVRPAGPKLTPVLAKGKKCLDMQEFQRVYQGNLDLIYHYVFRKVGNRQEAEDLTSQIFIKALCGIDTARASRTIQKWLFQIACTTIADYWRTHDRSSVQSLDALVEAGWEGPVEADAAVVSSSSVDYLHSILQALPVSMTVWCNLPT